MSGMQFEPINIVFDGPPGPDSCKFVEVELDNGQSIRAGEWIERPDGLWSLRIIALPPHEHDWGPWVMGNQSNEHRTCKRCGSKEYD